MRELGVGESGAGAGDGIYRVQTSVKHKEVRCAVRTWFGGMHNAGQAAKYGQRARAALAFRHPSPCCHGRQHLMATCDGTHGCMRPPGPPHSPPPARVDRATLQTTARGPRAFGCRRGTSDNACTLATRHLHTDYPCRLPRGAPGAQPARVGIGVRGWLGLVVWLGLVGRGAPRLSQTVKR